MAVAKLTKHLHEGHGKCPCGSGQQARTCCDPLAPPAKGNRLIRDSEFRGFALRVTANGARSFTLTYRIDGRQRRYTIGPYPAWSPTAAREEAGRLRRKVDNGIDPLAEKEERRNAPTVNELADDYLAFHALPYKRASSVAAVAP